MAVKPPTVSASAEAIVNTIHGIANGAIPQRAQVGIILAPPPDIQVQLNNIILTRKDVYISEYLLIGYERTAKGHIASETQPRAGGGGDAEFASHTHDINNDYTDNVIYTDTLKVGDRVSVIPMEGDQLYFIEDKVVKL